MRRRTLLACLAALATRPALAAGPLDIYAVNAPLAYFAERLAGEAEVVLPVPEGRDPNSWTPPIPVIAEFQAADLILLNGAGYAPWTTRTSLPRARSVMTSRAFEDRLIEVEGVVHSHGAEGEHSHAATAAITWLDFAQAAEQARAVADAIARAAPDAAADVATRLEELNADLAALDAEARRVGAAAAGATVIALQPSYHYFARAYGLDIEHLDWDPAAPPGPEELAALDAALAGAPRAIVLAEAEPPPETAAALRERGATLVVFDPAAGPPADRFLDVMRANLAALAEAAERASN